MITNIYIGEDKLDLFEDEGISIVSSVLDISDVKKNTGDFSQSFTVPPTKNNNKIFKHWFNANLDNSFDARTKADGRVELSNLTFKNGGFLLSKVNVKSNEVVSYTINFSGNLSSLVSVLRKDELSSLDFSAFNHDHTAANIKTGLTSELFSGSIKYTPLVKKQYFFNSDNDNTQTPTLSNISSDGGNDTGIVWSDLRPAIKCIDIIEAIEDKYIGRSQQRSAIVVNAAPTGGGTAIITLNGTAHNIVLTGGLSTADLLIELDTAINLISGYYSTVSSAFAVSVFSVAEQRQEDTIFDTGTTTGMVAGAITVVYGSSIQGIEFSRDFFGTSEFEDLYMWLNPDKGLDLGGDSQRIAWDGGNLTYINPITYVGTYPYSVNAHWSLSVTVTPDAASMDIPYQILSYKNGELIHTSVLSSGVKFGGFQIQGIISGDTTAYFEVKPSSSFTYIASIDQTNTDYDDGFPPDITITTSDASSNTTVSTVVVSENMPKLKIIDFLKGIFDMFKLVVIPTESGELYVNTLNAYYSEGKTYDVTKYIKFDEDIPIKRGKILNEINFKFQEPTTILNEQFEINTGIPYGDEETILYTDETKTELLDGSSLDIEVPFEQIIYDRLLDLDNNSLTNIMYGAIIDQELSPANPKAHLMYIIPKSQAGKNIGFIDELGAQTVISGNLNIPSHTEASDFPNYSTVFGREENEWNGDNIENTLYKNHWENYFSAIFNVKKRETEFKAELPLWLRLKLRLNDVLSIKGNFYRIDKDVYNSKTNVTSLNTVNSFDNTINPFIATPLTLNRDSEAVTQTVTITNSEGATSAKTDLGFGTSWATVSTISTLSNVFYLSFAENTTEYTRVMRIVFTQAVTGATQTLFISQNIKTITLDSDEITFDSNITTFDQI